MWQDIPSFQILWSKEITNKSTWEIEYNVRIAVRHEMGIWNRICFFSIWSHSLLRLGSWDSIMGRFVTCFFVFVFVYLLKKPIWHNSAVVSPLLTYMVTSFLFSLVNPIWQGMLRARRGICQKFTKARFLTFLFYQRKTH